MSEWKELKIDNLPPDILTGDYEFNYGDSYSSTNGNYEENIKLSVTRRIRIFDAYLGKENGAYVRYRKPEPLPPTHEEIMTKWWRYHDDEFDDWYKVVQYSAKEKKYTLVTPVVERQYGKSWFMGRESADIPPEE